MIATLDELDEQAMVDILVKPKNALTKQYQKLLEMDGVKLIFAEGCIEAIAKKAIKKNTGARGLRAILETTMLEVMYEIPAKKDMAEVIIHPGRRSSRIAVRSWCARSSSAPGPERSPRKIWPDDRRER